MNENLYDAYAYKRYRKPKHFFAVAFLALFIGVTFFVSNLMFGFVQFRHEKPIYVTAPEWTFYAVKDGVRVTEIALIPLENGEKYTTKPRKIRVLRAEQREIIDYLVQSFIKSFDTVLNNSGNTRALYNEIYDYAHLFETWTKTSWSDEYTDLLKYITRELFGLNQMWINGNVTEALSWIALSFYDFTQNV